MRCCRYYDVKVVSNGRTGKGTDLFRVIQKGGQACDAGTFKPATVIETVVPAPPTAGCQVGVSGALDCAFGTGGLVTTAIRPPFGFATNLTAQPDGKLIALVKAYRPDTDQGYSFYVVRYEVDGSLDGTFGTGGVVRLEFTPIVDRENADAIALQPDGKIIVAGNVPVTRGSSAAVARLLPNGSLDPTFATGGRLMFSFGSTRAYSNIYAIQLQGDGRIVVAGTTEAQFAVARLTANGALDGSFGNNGKVVIPVGQAADGNSNLSSVAIQEWSGEQYLILAGGSPTCSAGPSRMAVVRLAPNGTVDSSFGATGNGQVLVSLGDGSSNVNGVVVDSSNRIVLVGTRASEGAVVRLAPNGVLDSSFGVGGGARFAVEGRNYLLPLRATIDDDGRLVFAGYAAHPNGSDWAFLVGRFLPNGQLDTSFGGGGVTITDFQIGLGQDWARGLVIQPSGRIVLAGVATPSLVGLAGYVP